MWNLSKFSNYLLENKLITDPNWLENYLKPAFKKSFSHLIRMSKDGFYKDPR